MRGGFGAQLHFHIVHGPTLPATLSAWFYFTAQTTATVLLCWFAMAIADKRHALLTRLPSGPCKLATLAAGLAGTTRLSG